MIWLHFIRFTIESNEDWELKYDIITLCVSTGGNRFHFFCDFFHSIYGNCKSLNVVNSLYFTLLWVSNEKSIKSVQIVQFSKTFAFQVSAQCSMLNSSSRSSDPVNNRRALWTIGFLLKKKKLNPYLPHWYVTVVFITFKKLFNHIQKLLLH